MKMTINIYKKNTQISIEGRPWEFKRITPELSFLAKKERDNYNKISRIDSLFKEYKDEHGIPF